MKWTQAAISEWANLKFGVAPSNRIMAARANEEMAALLGALAVTDFNPAVGEEIADVIIVLCSLASRMGIDIASVVQKKMEINAMGVWNLTE